MSRWVFALALVGALLAACSSSASTPPTTLSIPVAQRDADHWQSIVNQDQQTLDSESGAAALSQSDACSIDPDPTACRNRLNQGYQQDVQKLKADQFQLQIAQDRLKQAENG